MHHTSLTIASSLVPRLRHFAGCIHALGPRPLFELFCELSSSPAVMERIASYAEIDPEVIQRFGLHALPPVLRRVK